MRIPALAAVVFIFTSLAAASISVTSPTNGSTVSGSVHVASTSSSSNPITQTIVYVDNQNVYSVSSATVNTTLTIASGGHTMIVQSWDTAGTVLKSSSINFTVSATASTVPSNAKVYANIDQMTGWDSCDSCAGAGGNGPKTTYSLTQMISSPSMDGKSAQFYLKPSQAYADALWWKQLGANSAVSNFQYDLYFYLKNPAAAQALEFDINQSINGKKYIFGTQCDIKGHHDWDVWGGTNQKWMQTGIACTAPTAYKWNHLTLEVQRANGRVKFIAVTLNGKKSYFNKVYDPVSTSASELNVAVQLDGNSTSTAYNEWADKITLSAW